MALYNLTGIDLDIFNAVNSAGYVFIFTAVVLPSLSLCVLTAVALFLAHSINWPLRIALINIFAGEITLWACYTVLYLGLPVRTYIPSETVTCQIFFSAAICAIVVSFSSIALYSIVVYIFIKYEVNKISLKVIFPIIGVIWVAALGVASAPYLSGNTLTNLGFCNFNAGLIALFPLFVMVVSLVLIITFSILTFHFMKENVLEENVTVKRAVAKNLAYLAIAAVLYFLAFFLPISFSYIRDALADKNLVPVILVEYVFRVLLMLPAVATPIVAIITLKPVRTAMKVMVCGCCARRHRARMNRVYPFN